LGSPIHRIIQILAEKNQPANETSAYLIKKLIQLLFLHFTGIILVFLSNYLLVKIAGVDMYGSYIYIFNLLYLLLAIAAPGTDTLLTKMNAVYRDTDKRVKLKGLLFFSIVATIIGSAIAATIATGVAGTEIIKKSGINNWYLFAFLTLIMAALSQMGMASLQGFSKIILGSIPEKFIRPATLILIISIIYLTGESLTLNKLIYGNVLAIFLTMAVTIIFLYKSAGPLYKNTLPEYELRNWSVSIGSFLILSILYIANSRIDIYMLGRLTNSDRAVGVYNIALRVSEIVSFSLILINFVLSPLIARLYASGEQEKLQKVVSQSSRLVVLIGLPLALITILFRKYLMAFFGVNILNGSVALLILCAGQIINIICGSVGLLLSMTGHQKYSIIGLTVGIIINISLNLILTPRNGLLGTAIATAASMAVWNILMYIFVLKKMKINTFAFVGIKKIEIDKA
jgi:O-antigen/teichoic acid export membrane protein